MDRMEFIEVVRRNDTGEMLAYLEKIYETRMGIPGWMENENVLLSKKEMVMAAHDMIRLANSLAQPARDLLSEISDLKVENSKLKRRIK